MGLCSSAGRPFKVLGLQQIAHGGPDKARLAKLWTDVLGVPCVGTFQSEKENVDEDILALGEACCPAPSRITVILHPIGTCF